MKNSMLDLHNHLMLQIETLADEELKGAELEEAIKRSTAVTKVANTMISNAAVVLKAEQMRRETGGDRAEPLPPMLTGNKP